MQLVPASDGNRVHEALLAFCAARLRIVELRQSTEPTRRTAYEQVRTYATRLVEEMERHGQERVHVPAGGGADEHWVVLTPVKRAQRGLGADAVVDAVRRASLEELARHGPTLTLALREYLRAQLGPVPTERRVAKVLRRAPRAGVPQVPAVASVAETARALFVCQQGRRARGAELRALEREPAQVCEAHESSVKQYIAQVSPAEGVAPIQIERAGAPARFYVRRKVVQKARPLTLRALLPLCEEVLRELTAPFADTPSEDALRTMQTETWLAELRARVDRRVEQLQREAVPAAKERVALERGLPRQARTSAPG